MIDLPPHGRMEWIEVTPAMAEQWLGRNTVNRKLRVKRVGMYAADMVSGRFDGRMSHQIIISDAGLANGQHRLEAVRQSGMTVGFWVLWLPGAITATGAIVDVGLGRSVGDVYGIGHNMAAVARALCSVASRNQQISHPAVKIVADVITAQVDHLTGTSRRGFTTAPVVAAVCFSMWRYPDDAEEIVRQYDARAKDEPGIALWPGFLSASRQIMERHSGGRFGNIPDVFLRIARGLDSEGRFLTKVQFQDQDIYRAQIEPDLRRYIGMDDNGQIATEASS